MALASKTFLEHWSKCGDSYVTRLSNADPETPDYTEIKGVTLHSGSRELRKEDKLNGIEWDGSVVIGIEVERSYFAQDRKFNGLGESFFGEKHKAGWEKWISGPGLPSFSLTRINGEWKCAENLKELRLDNKQPVQCGELPK